jgi:hypothetical protein
MRSSRATSILKRSDGHPSKKVTELLALAPFLIALILAAAQVYPPAIIKPPMRTAEEKSRPPLVMGLDVTFVFGTP